MSVKSNRRLRIKAHIRHKVSGTAQKPRLTVFRSNTQIYAQVIDDVSGKTLASASTVERDFTEYGGNKAAARKVGNLVAKRALEKGIETVVFDRGGYIYHGRVAALAAAAREAGLDF